MTALATTPHRPCLDFTVHMGPRRVPGVQGCPRGEQGKDVIRSRGRAGSKEKGVHGDLQRSGPVAEMNIGTGDPHIATKRKVKEIFFRVDSRVSRYLGPLFSGPVGHSCNLGWS